MQENKLTSCEITLKLFPYTFVPNVPFDFGMHTLILLTAQS